MTAAAPEPAGRAPFGRTDRVALAAWLAIAAALRLWDLGGADLWSDEVHTFDAVRLPFGEMVTERLRAGHVPLHFALVKGWTALFGTSQLALRLPSALLGTALLVPAFALFRRVLPAKGARWALGLTAVHPLLVELSREARMYPLLLLLFLVAAEGAFSALDAGRVPARFWAAGTLGPLVHPTWGFALLPLVYVVVRERPAAKAARSVLIGLLGSACILAAGLALAEAQHPEMTRRPWPKELLAFAIRPLFGTASLGVSFIALVGGGCMAALWMAIGALNAERRTLRFAVALLLGVPAVALLAGLLGGLAWGPARYVQAATLGAILLGAAGLGAVEPETPGRLRDHRGWLLVLLLGLFSVNEVAFAHGTGWSDAARQLRGAEGPVVVQEPGGRVVLAHYLGRRVEAAPPEGADGSWRVSVDRRHHAVVERTVAQTVERIEGGAVTPR